jgi:hypothetical protein
MKTIDCLSIVWTNSEGQEEVNGLTFYGLFENNSLDESLIRGQIINDWIGSNIQCRTLITDYEEFNVLSVDLRFIDNPRINFWFENLTMVFTLLVKMGGIKAWCGNETCSPNPEVLVVNNSAGNVYAFYSSKLGLICNSSLDQELKYVDDFQLEETLEG